jgi:drug/metabolite transporter (DMT)-like permease
MPIDPKRRALWQIHFCVLLWGFTAILGKVITLPATALVVWRMGLVTLMIALWPKLWSVLRRLAPRMLAIYSGIGCIVALHWLTFYASIKMANASVAVACVALSAVFAAILEPFITGRKHDYSELALGVLAVPGVVLIVGGVPEAMLLGLAIGIVSAFLSSLFAALNKRYIEDADPVAMTFVEMGTGAVFLLCAGLLVFGPSDTLSWPSGIDFTWLLVLAAVCTLLPYVLWLHTLRHLSAFATQLALNLEPVYAIVLAALWFAEYEELTASFYLGTAIVLVTVFLQPQLERIFARR